MPGPENLPELERFSLNYLRQGTPGSDSPRMRTRLGILISKLRLESLYELIRGRLGAPVPVGFNGVQWVTFFETAKLRDVLDTITLAYHAIQAGRVTPSREAERFVREVNTIFQEEHVGYRADERGVVRFAVDAEFEASRLATIAGLGQSRFANAASNFDEVHRELSKTPPDGKGAVRATFDAAENVFKVMFDGERRLSRQAIEKQLVPVVQRLYTGNGPAREAALKQLEAFCDWVEDQS